MPRLLRDLLIGVVVVLVQWLVVGRLLLWGAYADIVLLFLVLQALRYGRLAGTVIGFVLGVITDVLYGTWGIQMFIKTLVGFFVGFFSSDDPLEHLSITPFRAFLGALVVALVHNGLIVVFHALDAGTRNSFMITTLWIGSAVYTAAAAAIAALFRSGRR